MTRASAQLCAGSTTPSATPDGPVARRPDQRPPSMRGLALAAVVLVLGALLAVCCCVDAAGTPWADGLPGAATTATDLDSHDVPAAAEGQGPTLRPVVSSTRFERAASADSCTTDASTVASTARPSRGVLSGGGGAPFVVASRLPTVANSVTEFRDASAPPPASVPSPYQLCVMRT